MVSVLEEKGTGKKPSKRATDTGIRKLLMKPMTEEAIAKAVREVLDEREEIKRI